MIDFFVILATLQIFFCAKLTSKSGQKISLRDLSQVPRRWPLLLSFWPKHSGNSRNNLLAIYFVALADQINLHLLARSYMGTATMTPTREYLANGTQFAILLSPWLGFVGKVSVLCRLFGVKSLGFHRSRS